MAKRKAKDLDATIPAEEPRRSSRRKATVKEDVNVDVNNKPLDARAISKPASAKPPKKTSRTRKEEAPAEEVNGPMKGDEDKSEDKSTTSSTKPPSKPNTASTNDEPTARQYWLMKAEPETRIEKGHDIKFSIDDLAAKNEPEPWDGIRAYPARNNLRAMKKGDLAFFYHSSCKVPAIVGIMEIAAEHTPDLTAHNASAPYYDASSKPDNPKWSVVHVEFRQKLGTPVTLKEMREFAELKEMQMLKLTRLSVSRVREEEWQFLVEEMKKRGDVIDL